MRFFLVLLLTAIFSYLAILVMPWWIPMLAGFVSVLLLPMRSLRSFLAAGTGAGLSFLLIAWNTDNANGHLLSRKMADIFSLPSYGFIILLTALCGFVTAGLGAWVAASLRSLLRPAIAGEEKAVGPPLEN